jgi:6-pyruvoyltetrahydropterin/6-carboxytetrahydropterin synthase
MEPMIRMSRKVYFASAHRYFQREFSHEENQKVFGACYTDHGHGHNYVLEAFFEGPINPQTGLLVNLVDVDKILKGVIAPLDHHHLNFDVPYFKDVIPTTENIARYCFDKVLEGSKGLPARLYKVRLFENEDLWVDYQPGKAK